jgi:hypothetical protein
MKKCQTCGFNNTDIMNFCLECGSALAKIPKMVIPLDSLSGQENPSDQVTEDYEKETVVGNRSIINQKPGFSNFQTPPPKPRSNAKIFLLLGGGLLAIVALIGVTATGILIYTLQSQKQTSSRPLVSKTPAENFPTPTPDETFPEIKETPQPTPIAKKTPAADEDPITFPVPQTPTKQATYQVKPLTGWQLSEIKTVPLENFRIRVSGHIEMDGVKKKVSAKGVKGLKDRRIVKKFPAGAVLMRTHYPDGRHSNIQKVSAGEYWQNYKNETGKIEFLVNDNSPEYNSGGFTITFDLINVPKR